MKEEKELKVENIHIFYCLQTFLFRPNVSSLGNLAQFLLIHQVLICGTYILLQPYQFKNIIQIKLLNKEFYKATILAIILTLAELQE